jgi:hypothetical protein
VRNEALAEYWIKSFKERYGKLPPNLEATVRAWADRVPTPGPDPSIVRPRIFCNIGRLHSRRLREWAREDGIDENDPALKRLVSALDAGRRPYRANETREEYRAEQKLCREEYMAAMKAYYEAHGKRSIRFPHNLIVEATSAKQ